MTPGSGVTLMTFKRGSTGGCNLHMDRGVELGRGRFDGGDELRYLLQPLERA